MYAAIVPLMKLPRQFGHFDYEIPESMNSAVGIGSLVTIPWRGRICTGIVFALHTQPCDGLAQKKIKSIDHVLRSAPLPKHCIDAMTWMSEHYFHSFATIAQALVPAPPARWIKKNEATDALTYDHITITTDHMALRHTLCYLSTKEKITTLLHVIAEYQENGSILIITPHHEDIPLVSTVVAELYPSRTTLYHGALSPTALWQTWQSILCGEKNIIIGTRMTILAPAQRIGAIIFLESESIDHRQYDQNPRFDAREVGVYIGELTRTPTFFLSHAHRPEEYIIADPAETVATSEPLTYMTLCAIPKLGRHSLEKILAPHAVEAMEIALSEKKKIFLFHNRRGSAHVLYCIDCKTLVRCERCTLPLAVHATTLRCHHCDTSTSLPSTCAKCHSTGLTPLGTGSDRLSSFLATRYPDARIATWDSDTKKTTVESFLNADIMIGTQLLLHDLCETIEPSPTFGVIIATCVDDFLSHANFRATENAWRMIQELSHLATSTRAMLYLQTFDTENPLIRSLLAQSAVFLPAEVASRKKHGYPPSTTLVTITSVDKNSSVLDSRMTQLRNDLVAVSSLTPSQIKIFGPLTPTPPFRHGKWRSAVAIKTPSITAELANFLRKLSDDFLIDCD